MIKTKKNIPKADSLMGSMRSIGYTFESAIADIIDNSISAHAKNIQLSFPTEASNCHVTIMDDGFGLTEDELFNAMRYGSTACEETRNDDDLGRFGLGLKAASLSQCRILSVLSKKGGKTSAFQWNYNHILKSGEWDLIILSEAEQKALPNYDIFEKQDNGTLVVWQDFDVIDKATNGQIFTTLCAYKDSVSEYVSLIFHRFLNSHSLHIKLNQLSIEGLDPFLDSKKEKVTRQKVINLAINDSKGNEKYVKVQPVILPYYKDLTKKDIKLLGGDENLRTKQGYYIYRNDRLIIWGTWFGLQRSELTKNARIRVDFPNSLDDIWKIDIKKQNASIPLQIRNSLKRAVSEAMNLSVKQQTHRGRKDNVEEKLDLIWSRIRCRDNQFAYEINRDSQFLNLIKQKLSDDDMDYLEMFIEEVERNLPVQQIYIDRANNQYIENEVDDRESDLMQKAIIMAQTALQYGSMPIHEIISTIMSSEPFCYSKDLEAELKKHFKHENK